MMRVTASKRFGNLDHLKVLASFLNFDWQSGDPNDFEKLKKEFSPIDWLFIQGALRNRDKAKAVQAELKTDLVPILAPEGKVTPEEAERRIGKLIPKLNEIESKIEWQIEAIDYELPPKDPEDETSDLAFRPLDPDEVESKCVLMDVSAELN